MWLNLTVDDDDDRIRSMQVQRKAMTSTMCVDLRSNVQAQLNSEESKNTNRVRYFMREFLCCTAGSLLAMWISFMHLKQCALGKKSIFVASFFPCSCQVSGFSIISFRH